MALDWNVHSPMGGNTWHPLRDAAPSIDSKTLLATLSLPILFRGSRAQLLAAFRFGLQNCPQGGPGMFCLGLQKPEMVDYTDRTPHWTAEATWAGIHNQAVTGNSVYAFTSTTKYTHRQTEFPVSFTKTGDSSPTYVSPGAPIVPNGNNPNTGIPFRGRRMDYVPVREVRGVIFSGIEPFPYHPHIVAMKARFLPPPSGVIASYGWLPDPVYVTWNNGNTAPATPPTSGGTGGNWFAAEIDTVDKFAPFNAGPSTSALYVVQAPFTYEQLRQAS